MPHSGGGGSRGGGHHHGSRGSSGPSHVRGQKRPYPGAKRFVYYHGHEPRYYYSDSPLTEAEYRKQQRSAVISGIVWLVIVAFLYFMFFDMDEGGPLDLNMVDRSIIIKDEAAMLSEDDRSDLSEFLSDFRDRTGVVFAIYTTPYRDLNVDVEYEAYDRYVRMFPDEKHWLIYYAGTDVERRDNWEWNLMCGDDCLRILDRKQEDLFTDVFHDSLMTDMSFADAVERAVSSLSPNLSRGLVYSNGTRVNGNDASGQKVSPLMFAFFPCAFGFIGVLLLVSGLVRMAMPIPASYIEKTRAYEVLDGSAGKVECPGCGKRYVAGIGARCPICGMRST